MKSLFKLTSGEIINMTDYYFEDGQRLKLEINDVDRQEIETPFGILIKVEEFTKEGVPAREPIYFMRVSDIEDAYNIYLGIESIIYV